MESNTLQVAAQLAQILGWPIAFFLIWALTRNKRNSDESVKSLAFEFRNLCNKYAHQMDDFTERYSQQMKMHLEDMREIKDALFLLVGSNARADEKLARIEEILKRRWES